MRDYFRKSPIVLPIVIVILIISFVTLLDQQHKFDVDSKHYQLIAQGQMHNVIKPFSSRILHPMFVRLLSDIFNISIDLSFQITAILSLTLFVASIMAINKSLTPNTINILILSSPLLVRLFQDCFLPDLFYSAILSLTFLALL